MKTNFTLSEPVYLMKMFRLLRLKQVFCVESVDTVGGSNKKIQRILHVHHMEIYVGNLHGN
jgi:hypothetical protein